MSGQDLNVMATSRRQNVLIADSVSHDVRFNVSNFGGVFGWVNHLKFFVKI